jgi:hypothetical protein
MSHEYPTVLVAVEGTELRNALLQRLQQDGYLVLEAADSAAALHIGRTHSRPIHIKIIPVSMDHELMSAVKQYRPKIKILLFAEHNEEPLQDVLTPETALAKIREYFNQ